MIFTIHFGVFPPIFGNPHIANVWTVFCSIPTNRYSYHTPERSSSHFGFFQGVPPFVPSKPWFILISFWGYFQLRFGCSLSEAAARPGKRTSTAPSSSGGDFSKGVVLQWLGKHGRRTEPPLVDESRGWHSIRSGCYMVLYKRWWFQIFLIFSPIWERFPFWLIFFLKGLKPPTRW